MSRKKKGKEKEKEREKENPSEKPRETEGGGEKAKKYMTHKYAKTEGEWTNTIITSLASRGGEDGEKAVLKNKLKEFNNPIAYPIIEWDVDNKRIKGTRFKVRNFNWEAQLDAATMFPMDSDNPVELWLNIQVDK